jgi:DNA-binding response OmpR family regulator
MDKRVLLIEDEPSIIEAIRFILTRDGWAVQSHSEGGTAVARVREAMPDVVILDVMLPGKSGFDILDDLRADPDLRHLPVLMLTARSQAADRARAARAGASIYMTKPFSNAEVLASVKALVAGP